MRILKNSEIDAKRVPLSGGTWMKGDVIFDDKKIECKCRANGFVQLYNWIEDSDYVAVKADRKEPLIVMRISEFIRILLG